MADIHTTNRDVLKHQIIDATLDAISQIKNPRLFRSERGYQGKLYCYLQSKLEERGILSDDMLLEIEYQKSRKDHHMRQRPDIILHIPREVSGEGPTDNNFCVWALKLDASLETAQEDFEKLDFMFDILHYPVGVFIDIGSQDHCLEHYSGAFSDRIIGISVELQGELLNVKMAMFANGEFVEQKIIY